MKIKLPPQQQALGTISGGSEVYIAATWLEKLKFLEQLQPLSDIAPSASFGVAALTPGTTSVSVTLAAITDNSDAAGTAQTYLRHNTNPLWFQLRDNIATLVVYLNAARTDLLASQTAVGALNTRVTALENKINAVIADLHARFP